MPHDERRTRGDPGHVDVPAPARPIAELPLAADIRPHPLRGTLHLPEGARGIVIVASSARNPDGAHRWLARDLLSGGFGVAHFTALLPETGARDPLSAFDTRVLSAQLSVATDLVASDGRFAPLPLAHCALGAAGAAAVIASADRPRLVHAIVLLDAPLIAASTSLPRLAVPTLLMLTSHSAVDSGFLVARPPGAVRDVRVLGRSAARLHAPGLAHRAALQAQQWFTRHLYAPH